VVLVGWDLASQRRSSTPPASSATAESGSDVADLLDQSLAVTRHGDEAVMLIEGCSGFVDGVDDHQSCGGNAAGRHGSAQGVQKQLATEPLPVQ
jgi:hypothetical protein